jgi:hypothetical protein
VVANGSLHGCVGEPPLTNYYYVVLAVGAGEATSPPSNRVAAFHFTLTPGAP